MGTWRVVGERADYPVALVSDRHDVVTLWQDKSPSEAIPFDRSTNVGLHHLALAVVDRIGLDTVYKWVSSWLGVIVEFGRNPRVPAPKSISCAGARGVRIEFAFDSRLRTRAGCGDTVQAAVGRKGEGLL